MDLCARPRRARRVALAVVASSGFDGTQFATSRPVVQVADGVGELSGLAQAPDGRISLGVSAPCNACVPTDADSAAVLSFLPDGIDLRVDASGVRAPVGLTDLPGSDVLFVTMNQRDDLGDATPGNWLAVVAPGRSWGFPDCDGQDESGCADQQAPAAELDAHAAVSGVGIVPGTLDAKVGTAAVVAEWSTGDVLTVPLDPDDPTAPGEPQVLITGMTHSMAVLAADGDLYIGDWASGTVVRLAASADG